MAGQRNGKTRRRVICPECGAKMAFTAPADAALAITCPKCRRSLRLPPLRPGDAGPASATEEPSGAPAPERARRPMLLASVAAAALALVALTGGLWAFGLLPGGGTDGETDAVTSAETTAAAVTDPSIAPSALPPKNASLNEQALAVLKRNCHECHGDGGSDEGGFNFVLNRATLVDEGFIVPGDAESSYLLERIAEGEMPPEDARVRPSEQEVAVLRRWIEAGAEDFAPPVARTFITGEAMFSAIRDDLRLKTEERDRGYVRYFTLTHLYNAGLSEDELQTYRLALSKLINSLSWEKELVIPRAIDQAGTVLRVDLRDLDWTEETWQAIIDADPYAIEHNTPAAQLCRDATGCTVPVVRGDWFVSAASSAPLYYKVLGVPEAEPMAMLEERVGLDVERSIAEEKVKRAGFGKSDVSQNNRMIERHATDHGAMWVSYDFAANTGRQNLFLHPLGPGDGEGDFRHDGGEIIFNLPNGLQGYLLVDASGKRLDKGPLSIVSDPGRPDRAVLNGISCMSCHYAGIISKRDEVRAVVEATPTAYRDDYDDILALYPPAAEMDALQEKDRERFTAAVETLGIERITKTAEPIVNMKRRFEADVDPTLAAAELGLETDKFVQLLEQFPSLARALAPLRAGKSVKRDVFATQFSATAQAFGLGTPIGSTSGSPQRTEPRPLAAGREWFDKTGKLVAAAEFVSADETTVTLKKADGETLKVEFAALADADRTFVLRTTAERLEASAAINLPGDLPAEALAQAAPPSVAGGLDEIRTWHDRGGNEIVGAFTGFDGRRVKILTLEDAELRLDIETISEQDLALVLSHYPEHRLWTPTSGDVEPFFAKYISQQGPVTMKLPNGKTHVGVVVNLRMPNGTGFGGPLDFLSKEDQEYLRGQPKVAVERPTPGNTLPRRRLPPPDATDPNAPPPNAPPPNAPPPNAPPPNAPPPNAPPPNAPR